MSKIPAPRREYYTLPEAAKALEISEYELRKAAKEGRIMSKRSSKAPRARILFKPEWLEDYHRNLRPSIFKRITAWVYQIILFMTRSHS